MENIIVTNDNRPSNDVVFGFGEILYNKYIKVALDKDEI